MAPTGTVFDIKRFAVHDGPGVRTVLFLKGCPLRCRWCHNPEGIAPGPQLAFHEHKCLHCGECVRACPRGAHRVEAGRHVFDREKCNACGACAEACPNRALKLYGRELAVEEARRIVLEDRDFYRDGGGVTLSGGEPLLQSGFCAALLRTLKDDGVHGAVDTSGAVPWARFEDVLPHAGLFLYDLKQADDGRHRAQTGGSNRRILGNLERLAGCGVPIEIRVPVVPGFNDDPASMDAIGALLVGRRNIVGVRLLPWHPARSKYAALGLDDALPETETPSAERMAALAARLGRVTGLAIGGFSVCRRASVA